MKNPLSRLNINVYLLSGCIVGGLSGLLAGLLQDHRISPLAAIGIEIVIIAIVSAVAILVNRAINRRRQAKVDDLRRSGLVPEMDKTADADVIRLAASGKRREAALVFWELHRKTMIEFAENAVGMEKFRLVDAVASVALLVGVGASGFVYFYHGGTVRSFVFCFAMALFCIAMRAFQHRRVLKNRTAIGEGRYPDAVARVLELQEHPKARWWCFCRNRAE